MNELDFAFKEDGDMEGGIVVTVIVVRTTDLRRRTYVDGLAP